jgi:hypothetical protein
VAEPGEKATLRRFGLFLVEVDLDEYFRAFDAGPDRVDDRCQPIRVLGEFCQTAGSSSLHVERGGPRSRSPQPARQLFLGFPLSRVICFEFELNDQRILSRPGIGDRHLTPWRRSS